MNLVWSVVLNYLMVGARLDGWMDGLIDAWMDVDVWICMDGWMMWMDG